MAITRLAIGLAVAAAGTFAVPAVASARPYLSAGEAARVTGRALHTKWDNLEQGSLNARCPATRERNLRRCSYTYFDHAGRCYWGDIGIRELRTRYVYRFLYDARCH